MSEDRYRVDAEGNPIDGAATKQTTIVLGAHALSTVLGVLIIVGLAIAMSDSRTLLLGLALAYALASIPAHFLLRRSLRKQRRGAAAANE